MKNPLDSEQFGEHYRFMAKVLSPGDPAPDFNVPVVGGGYPSGARVSLAALAGKIAVLYFYPKDDTPGCTAQACGLRDGWDRIAGRALVFGVSIDPPESHSKFIEKYSLPFPLLSDERKEMVEAYGVWVEKSMYGKSYMGTERTTFIIGGDSRIKAVLRKVKPDQHLDLILAAL